MAGFAVECYITKVASQLKTGQRKTDSLRALAQGSSCLHGPWATGYVSQRRVVVVICLLDERDSIERGRQAASLYPTVSLEHSTEEENHNINALLGNMCIIGGICKRD